MAKANSVSVARLSAFEVLRKVENGGLSSSLLAAKEPDLSPKDRALCHELVLGVLRWQALLDLHIEHYANRNVSQLDQDVLLALRLGLYQLRFLSRIPPSAAVNESVKLVGKARLRSAQSFVNAVLRRATREPDYDPMLEIHEQLERVAMQTSHPRWLIERWAAAFGEEIAHRIADANNLVPTTTFRVVHSNAEESEILNELKGAHALVSASTLTPKAWRVSGAVSLVQQLALNGKIYLQDEASQLVAQLLQPQIGERILDVCAAPGGKSTQIADLTSDRAFVVACDRFPKRLETIVKSIELQNLKSLRVTLLDAERPLPFLDGTFDRVLVDAPCSGTGTLRHNPEIRWRITEDDIKRMSLRQAEILKNAAQVVRPGGRLLYSTCSLEREENEEVIAAFLERNADFKLMPVSVGSSLQTATRFVRTWPHVHGTDGFFVALTGRVGQHK